MKKILLCMLLFVWVEYLFCIEVRLKVISNEVNENEALVCLVEVENNENEVIEVLPWHEFGKNCKVEVRSDDSYLWYEPTRLIRVSLGFEKIERGGILKRRFIIRIPELLIKENKRFGRLFIRVGYSQSNEIEDQLIYSKEKEININHENPEEKTLLWLKSHSMKISDLYLLGDVYYRVGKHSSCYFKGLYIEPQIFEMFLKDLPNSKYANWVKLILAYSKSCILEPENPYKKEEGGYLKLTKLSSNINLLKEGLKYCNEIIRTENDNHILNELARELRLRVSGKLEKIN